MKIILLSDWDPAYPMYLKPYIEQDAEGWRFNQTLIKKIEKEAIPYNINYRHQHNGPYVIMECDNRYCEPETKMYRFYDSRKTLIVIITEVDTSRPWTILEYDSSEYIQYLDYDVINEKANYCRLKEKDRG